MTSLKNTILAKAKEYAEIAVLIESNKFSDDIHYLCNRIKACLDQSGCIFLGGNGGSYAEALHIAAEFVGRFKLNRNPLKSQVLGSNSSSLTAIANDFGYESVFSREIEAFCSCDDLVILLSTSGSSTNIIEAMKACKEKNCEVILLTSINFDGTEILHPMCKVIQVPFKSTDTIQEIHLMMLHLVCSYFEP